MMDLESCKKEVTSNNVNYFLDKLYKERDKIGEEIDKCLWKGYSTESLENTYQEICDTIEYLCNFRRKCDYCALEGDPEYGLV